MEQGPEFLITTRDKIKITQNQNSLVRVDFCLRKDTIGNDNLSYPFHSLLMYHTFIRVRHPFCHEQKQKVLF
jgi:hypothetical protein